MMHSKEHPWRQSQRERLHFLTHNTSIGGVPILVERNGKAVVELYPRNELNERWMDVGLAGGPSQASHLPQDLNTEWVVQPGGRDV